jgi:hypothetical protein
VVRLPDKLRMRAERGTVVTHAFLLQVRKPSDRMPCRGSAAFTSYGAA